MFLEYHFHHIIHISNLLCIEFHLLCYKCHIHALGSCSILLWRSCHRNTNIDQIPSVFHLQSPLHMKCYLRISRNHSHVLSHSETGLHRICYHLWVFLYHVCDHWGYDHNKFDYLISWRLPHYFSILLDQHIYFCSC